MLSASTELCQRCSSFTLMIKGGEENFLKKRGVLELQRLLRSLRGALSLIRNILQTITFKGEFRYVAIANSSERRSSA